MYAHSGAIRSRQFVSVRPNVEDRGFGHSSPAARPAGGGPGAVSRPQAGDRLPGGQVSRRAGRHGPGQNCGLIEVLTSPEGGKDRTGVWWGKSVSGRVELGG